MLLKQKRTCEKDYRAVSKAFPQVVHDDYLYYWLVINTRSFYYVRPGSAQTSIITSNDCMALCPFIDYFNHSDSGVSLSLFPRFIFIFIYICYCPIVCPWRIPFSGDCHYPSR
jgi:hypothetical protein